MQVRLNKMERRTKTSLAGGRATALICGAFATLLWVQTLAAFEIRLFPAGQVFDHDPEYLHERIGVISPTLRVEDFEDTTLEEWLRASVKGGARHTADSAWDGHSASEGVDDVEFEIRLPGVRVFGVGLSDDGSNERISINGDASVLLKKMPGHASNSSGRAFFVLVIAEPNDPDIRTVAFDQGFTVHFDHLFVSQDRIQKPAAETKRRPRLVLGLIDGTRLVGDSQADSLRVSVPGAELELELSYDRISSMRFRSGTHVASVILKNGERVICHPRFSEVKVRTILGEFSIPPERIRHLKVTPRGEHVPTRETRRDRVERPFHADEPSWEGKTLRAWLDLRRPKIGFGHLEDMLSPRADSESTEQQEGHRAIRTIGPVAVPFLVEMLERGERSALYGFEALGDLAKEALPELLILLEEPDELLRFNVISAIGHIGPAARGAIPILIEELQLGRQSQVTAEALGNIGPAAAEAVPIILSEVMAGEHPYDVPLVRALGKLKSSEAIPLLRAIAEGTDARRKPSERGYVAERRKHEAVMALGNLGPPAVLVLVELLKGQKTGNLTDLYLSERIIGALGSIGPPAREAIPAMREFADRPWQWPEANRRIAESVELAMTRIRG